jgi:hypothetical protein
MPNDLRLVRKYMLQFDYGVEGEFVILMMLFIIQ